jgi:hypothetical protein
MEEIFITNTYGERYGDFIPVFNTFQHHTWTSQDVVFVHWRSHPGTCGSNPLVRTYLNVLGGSTLAFTWCHPNICEINK